MSMEQDNSKMTGEMISGESANENESTPGQAWPKFIRWLDAFLNKLYQNQRDANPPEGIEGKIWGMPPWAPNSSNGESYFLNYFQSQGHEPTDNECVTTCTLMSINMLEDWAASRGYSSEIDRSLKKYTTELDALGLRGWKYRFSTHSPFPGMMTPWQAVFTLKDFATSLGKKYGKSYRVKLSAHHMLLDLIEHLQNGDIILIHGAWQMNLESNALLAFLGGMPHTMLLVGYDGGASRWLLLNPADPRPAKDQTTAVTPKIYRMDSKELMDFWGRKFLFYPPRFAFTTITLDA
jgi:hypothetical protein